MKIIAHRGSWSIPEEKNTVAAFQKSIESGFGIETDIRDYHGQLVISHDVPKPDDDLLSFNDFLELYIQNKDKNALLAVNIKSDGLQHLLSAALKKQHIDSYFAFDMSFPGMFFSYRNSGLKYYTSVNEYIQKPILLNEADGIWLDAYDDIWYSTDEIAHYLNIGKHVCIVSPELHSRDYLPLWQDLKSSGIAASEYLSLCTDFPDKANSYFN